MMRKIVSLFLIVGSVALATEKVERPLPELIAEADYIVVGKITRVAMFDRRNREVTDPRAETGPGLENEIRFFVRVAPDGFLKVRKSLPQDIVIARWKMWHMDLATMKEEAEGNSYIFLMESDPSRPVFTLEERLFLDSRSEVEALIQNQKRESNQPPQPTPGSSAAGRG
ncbi:MAG: hypothetical protein R3F03_05960 [Opitutaceae bacterium]